LWVSRGFAAIRGRDHVIPDDVKDAAVPVLSHRIVFRNSFGADKNKAKTFVEKILDSTPVPSEAIEFSRR
jgi:MoxR-like ATPase